MHYRHLGPLHSGYDHNPLTVKKGDVLTFIDAKYLGYCTSLERILYYPERQERPVMTATKPWERNGKYQCVGGFSGKCIVKKDDKLQMFYSVYHMNGYNEWRSFAYAESKDGIYWTKPNINKGTNLLIDNRDVYDIKKVGKQTAKKPYYELQNVIWDEHSNQYLGLGHSHLGKGRGGAFVAHTKDPFNWNPKDFQVLYKNADIHALMGWDEEKERYLSYIRCMVYQDGICKRAIGVSASKDFKKWTTPCPCLLPWGGRDHQIYNMPVTKLGGYYLAFPITYYSARDHGGMLDSALWISHDGLEWAFQDSEYIKRGLPGEWDDCYAMTSAPIEFGDSLYFYYWGANFPHDTGFAQEQVDRGSVGIAILPKNRMYSLACDRHLPATLTFRPIRLPIEPVKVVLNAHFPNGTITARDDMKSLALVPKNGLEFYLEKDGKREWTTYSSMLNLELYLSDAEVFSLSFE